MSVSIGDKVYRSSVPQIKKKMAESEAAAQALLELEGRGGGDGREERPQGVDGTSSGRWTWVLGGGGEEGGEGKGLMANECMTTPQLWNGKMCGKFIGSNEIPGFYLMPTIISDISKFGLLYGH